MLKLLVTYKAKDVETRQAFYDEVAAAGIPEASRAEEGNICYDYFFSMDRENEILLVEKWQDKEAQKLHSTLPHFKKVGELKEKYGIESIFEEL